MLISTRQADAEPVIYGFHIVPALIILLREIAVSGLREFLAGLQVSLPVSRLAKWKTALQLIALGALILGAAVPQWPWVHRHRPRQPVGGGDPDPGDGLGLSEGRPEAHGLTLSSPCVRMGRGTTRRVVEG